MNQNIEAHASSPDQETTGELAGKAGVREILKAKALAEAEAREAQVREIRARAENGVRIGQVWIDRDNRNGLRLLEIVSIENGRATCKVIHTGKDTRISTRCLPWSNKYKLLLDVINEEPASCRWSRPLAHGFQIVSGPDK